MNPVRALRQLAAFRRLIRGEEPQVFVHRHDPERIRATQRRAAREAWLSQQTAAQRQLAAPFFGDIH